MIRNDRHALFAIASVPEGPHALSFRVGQPVDWNTAQARWQRLDDRRIAGRKQYVRHDGRRYPVAAFEVRAVDKFGRGLGSDRHKLAFPVPFRLCRLTNPVR